MGQTEESIHIEARQRAIQEAKIKKMKRKTNMLEEMNQASLLMSVFIFVKYQWSGLLVLFGLVITTGIIAGLIGRIIWEVWKMIFSVNL